LWGVAVFLGNSLLDGLARRYDALGDAWRDLAAAALPGEVPLLAETRALLDRRDAVFAAEGADATDELRGIWARLDVLAEQADAGFPLAAAVDELLRGLQARLVAIYQDEVAARDELRAILA
jgi:hypothetical protein